MDHECNATTQRLHRDQGNHMIAAMLSTMRELSRRSSDGIYVRLLWSKHDGRVAVAVTDTKTGDVFSVEVGENERALDVFHHPYVYAAWRDIDTRRTSPSGEPVRMPAIPAPPAAGHQRPR
jgi:hypothetical protein